MNQTHLLNTNLSPGGERLSLALNPAHLQTTSSTSPFGKIGPAESDIPPWKCWPRNPTFVASVVDIYVMEAAGFKSQLA